MKDYLAVNTKMAKISGERTFNWGIPAFRSQDGSVTCPGAGKCAAGCYAQQMFYIMGHVKRAYEARLELSRSPEFVDVISAEIIRRKVRRLRVHDSGDFYSADYADNWAKIAKAFPLTHFYSYTKNIPLIKCLFWPKNFTFIYSEGGKFDKYISYENDRHSRVFLNREELLKAGYADASTDDSQALGENLKVGLIYHGHANRAFKTEAPHDRHP